MPHRRRIGRELDRKQGFDDAKQPTQHLRLGKVLLHFVVGEAVALLLELFRGPGEVPTFKGIHAEFLPGEIAQFGDVALGKGARLGRHVALEGRHLGRRVRHLGRQRDFGVAGVTEHLRLLVAQCKQAVDQRAVVPAFRAELGSARGVGAVHARAQIAVVAELQYGNVGRRMQSELPSRLAVLRGGFPRGCPGVGGQTLDRGLVLDPFGMCIGRVQHVLGKLRAQRRQFFLDFLEARLAVFRQFRAREPEIAQVVFDDATAGRRQGRKFRARRQQLELGEQRKVLPQVGIEAGNLRQHGVVSLAPRRHVVDRMQVADDAPGARQALAGIEHRLHEGIPGCGGIRRNQAIDQGAVFVEQLAYGGGDVFRLNSVKAGQPAEIE